MRSAMVVSQMTHSRPDAATVGGRRAWALSSPHEAVVPLLWVCVSKADGCCVAASRLQQLAKKNEVPLWEGSDDGSTSGEEDSGKSVSSVMADNLA